MPTNTNKSEPPVAVGVLFIAFLKVALFGFGSGLAWARRIAVEQRQWISGEEFSDIVSICQFMPGPNVIGISVCVGARLRGLAGAIAAASGFVFIPLVIGFLVGQLLLAHAHVMVLQNVLGGVSAAAAGLIIATGLRMLMPYRRRLPAMIVVVVACGAIVFTKLPLLVVLTATALLSTAIAGIGDVDQE